MGGFLQNGVVTLYVLILLQECYEACRRWSVGSVTVALFGIVQGGMQIGQSATFAEAFNTARGAAYEIFQVIYRDRSK